MERCHHFPFTSWCEVFVGSLVRTKVDILDGEGVFSLWYKLYHSVPFVYVSHPTLVKSLSRVWLCDFMDCSPPGSSVHGILQARILERVAISFSRGSSRPRDRTQVSRIRGRRFNLWTTREAPPYANLLLKTLPVVCRVKARDQRWIY